MSRLTFHAPSGLAGRFVSVRPGLELASALQKGDEVEMVDATGQTLGYAIASDCWAGDLALIPASILEMEQNALHRTYSGLIMGLRAVSDGQAPIEPSTKVTALVLDFARGPLQLEH